MRWPGFPLFALTIAASGVAQSQDAARPTEDERAIIFFAWDRLTIDGDAASRLDAIAAAYRRTPGARLELSGHADRSGPAAANARSSRLRAEAVKTYLAARGVAEAAMVIVPQGEMRPLIPTADGVREPHNRRVEIVTLRGPAS